MPPKRRQKKDPPRSAGGASGLPGNVNDLRTYSAGLRWLMVEWHVLDGLNYEQIGRRLSTGSHRCWGTSVRAICKLFLKHNHVKPGSRWQHDNDDHMAEARAQDLGGFGCFSAAEMSVIKTAMEAQPDMFVTTELTDVVRELTGRDSLHPSTVWRAVRELGLTRKKIEHHAFQRDERLRSEWRLIVAAIPDHERFFFLDESGFGAFIHRRLYGYALRNMPAIVKEPFYNCGNMSMLSTVGLDGVVLQHYVRGAFDADLFLGYMRELVMEMPAHSYLVMDNCRIHHTHIDMLRALFALKNIAILFLPPYSPDFNPIEKFFGGVKAELKGNNKHIYETMDQTFHQDQAGPMKLSMACDMVPKQHFAAWFRNCGYTV